MHIERDRLNELAEAFKVKYGFPLIGDELCQFHSDFSSAKLEKLCPGKEIYAKESYFLAKKIYIDKLTCEGTDEVDLHIRLKGITPSAIKALADKQFNNDIFALYLYLYKHSDETIQFNLADGKASFELDKEMRVFTRHVFYREVGIPDNVKRCEIQAASTRTLPALPSHSLRDTSKEK